MILDLADLKAHLKVDGDNEDALVEIYALAAEAMLANWIGRPIYRTQADLPALGALGYDQYQLVADAAISLAILMLADRMYNSRDGDGAAGPDAVPPVAVQALLSGYRVFRPAPREVCVR